MTAKPRALPWITRLIAHDTTSRNSNLMLIDDVRSHVEALGLRTLLTFDDTGRKANLFATIPDAAGNVTGGVILSGHTDVVPTDGQDWTSDPFRAEVRDGRLYGRGACDMKGFIGVVLSLIESFSTRRLRRPIHLALSYDEELGCLGAPAMIADFVARDVRPDSCIVGEPTSMQPVSAHKGVRQYRCRVHGRSAHSSRTPDGVNAIEYAARIISYYRAQMDAERLGTHGDTTFDIPFTTGSVGSIQGGTAINIVAQDCEFLFDCRPMPGYDVAALQHRLETYIADEILPAMRAEHADTMVTLEPLVTVPSLAERDDSALLALALALTRVDRPAKAAYSTEAGQFSQADIDTIVCGPGDIAQAHRPDEYVAIDQIVVCERFLLGVAENLAF